MTCNICLMSTSNIIFVPCNHLGVCSECFKEMLKANKNQLIAKALMCPLCRAPMDEEKFIVVKYKDNWYRFYYIL